MNGEIYYADARQLAGDIRSKSISPVEVMNIHLDRIEKVNGKLNAIVTLCDDSLDLAIKAEEAIMRDEIWGPLHGVPFTIKDCIDTKGVRTTRGSVIFKDHFPTKDATVVTRLKDAGGIMLGKTNMPEFALWWETGNRVFGRTENPWMDGRTPGGSSGGEAAAIAAGLSPMGIGSDLGGSIRQPAHYSGIVGLKATHGRIPLTGHWPDTLLRFMHVGPMARSVQDIAMLTGILAGSDGFDHYAVPFTAPSFSNIECELKNLRIGWCGEGPFAPVHSEVLETVKAAATSFSDLGCEVELIELDDWTELDTQNISATINAVEGGSYLDPIIAGSEAMLAESMQRRLVTPKPSHQEYVKAVNDLERLRRSTSSYFRKYDVLLCPTGPVPAHPHDSFELDVEGCKVPGRNALKATIPSDLTGCPAISIPYGWSKEGLPIGVQLIANHYREDLLLQVAYSLEAINETSRKFPQV